MRPKESSVYNAHTEGEGSGPGGRTWMGEEVPYMWMFTKN